MFDLSSCHLAVVPSPHDFMIAVKLSRSDNTTCVWDCLFLGPHADALSFHTTWNHGSCEEHSSSANAYRSTARQLTRSSGGRVCCRIGQLPPRSLLPFPYSSVARPTAFLSLLCPQPSSKISRVCTSQIVIAGDSFGDPENILLGIEHTK